MTYDVVLVLRTGWGREEMDRVAPDFLAALRFALFAERVAPMLDDARRILAMKPENVNPSDRVALNRERLVARQQTDIITAALLPEDPDG